MVTELKTKRRRKSSCLAVWDDCTGRRHRKLQLEVLDLKGRTIVAEVTKKYGWLVCGCGFKSERDGWLDMATHLEREHKVPWRVQTRKWLRKLWLDNYGVRWRLLKERRLENSVESKGVGY